MQRNSVFNASSVLENEVLTNFPAIQPAASIHRQTWLSNSFTVVEQHGYYCRWKFAARKLKSTTTTKIRFNCNLCNKSAPLCVGMNDKQTRVGLMCLCWAPKRINANNCNKQRCRRCRMAQLYSKQKLIISILWKK